jgi:flotillin
MIPMLVVGALVLLLIAFFIYLMVTKLLYVATPNEVLVFSGTTRVVGGRTLPYRFVRGGRSMRKPLVEKVERMDLSMFTVMVSVEQAFTKGGIPLNVQGVANVKLPGEEPLLTNAVVRFLGRSREEIYHVAKETLEGNLRGVLASLTPEQVNEDKVRFAQTLVEEAEHDLNRIGLVLDTLKIQNVFDTVNYLSSIGRIRSAGLNQQQAIGEVEARADAQVQQSANWAASEVAKVNADIEIARQETHKRIADATSRRDALIKEAEGEVIARIAEVRADIERQRARALQVKRQLDADVVQPAVAARQAAEEAARGEAAWTVERGRAEAESLRKLVEAYQAGGSGARDVLALQNLLPLLGQVSGSEQQLRIRKVSLLAGGAPGGELARASIGVNEQVRAATGVDLAGLARRLGAQPTARDGGSE